MRSLKWVLIGFISFLGLNLFSQTTSCFTLNPIVNATCPGGKTGSISLNISGGSGSYSIFLMEPQLHQLKQLFQTFLLALIQ